MPLQCGGALKEATAHPHNVLQCGSVPKNPVGQQFNEGPVLWSTGAASHRGPCVLEHRGQQYKKGPEHRGTQASNAKMAQWTGVHGPCRPTMDLSMAAQAKQQCSELPRTSPRTSSCEAPRAPLDQV